MKDATKDKRIVLVVDDDRATRKTISAIVQEWGYGVVEACDGMEAFTMLDGSNVENIAFYAIITDMRMPRASGLVLCQMLKQSKNVLPVLVHSSETTYKGDGVDIKDLEDLKKSFPFIKMTRKKPGFTGYMGYVKSFLNAPELPN